MTSIAGGIEEWVEKANGSASTPTPDWQVAQCLAAWSRAKTTSHIGHVTLSIGGGGGGGTGWSATQAVAP